MLRAVKTLTLIRHAKSSWDLPALDDRDRPLNPRGRRDAPEMARRLAERGFAPDRIVTSPALRALRTAEIFAAAIGYPLPRVVLDPRLYDLEAEDLLALVRSLEAGLNWVAWVGHNPALTDLAGRLAGKSLPNVPTCGVVELGFVSADWGAVGRRRPDTFVFDFPKRLTAP